MDGRLQDAAGERRICVDCLSRALCRGAVGSPLARRVALCVRVRRILRVEGIEGEVHACVCVKAASKTSLCVPLHSLQYCRLCWVFL